MASSAVFEWNGVSLVAKKYTYPHTGAIAIRLYEVDNMQEPYATATVAIKGAELFDDETLIKNYSENEGLLEAMEAANLVERSGGYVNSGFVSIPIVKVLF